MNNESLSLLQRLASGIRPQATGAAATHATGTGQAGFLDLLQKAQAGDLVSERPVSIGREAAAAGIRLDDSQLARISAAADKAEVSGIRTALVLIDGQALNLDISSRTITGAADAGSGLVSGIDGLINLSPNLLAPTAQPPILPLPLYTGGSASLASLMEQRERGDARAA